MIAIYGKWKVWNALKNLLDKLNIPNKLMDDTDFDKKFLKVCDKIVVSPWIPPKNFVYKKYKNKIVWELDFVREILEENEILQNFEFIWITWTDWKSTTTWVIYNLFKELISPLNNSTTRIWWNFDPSFSEIIYQILENWRENYKNIIILEVSSFMGYNVKKFKFDYSIWLNFFTDHLNWHVDMQDYFDAKANIIKNTKYWSILWKTVIEKFGQKEDYNIEIQENNIDISKTKFVWQHNLENLSHAYSLILKYIKDKELNISNNDILEKFYEIKPLSHRTEFIKQIWDIKIYDDGKSTTANSLRAWIQSFGEKIILIAWGSDKWDDFSILQDVFADKLNWAVLIWETAKHIWEILNKSWIDYIISWNLQLAITRAYELAKKTWTKIILFSPWCASFDMFANRLDRVEKFLDAIQILENKTIY